jgi:hypothetical protein
LQITGVVPVGAGVRVFAPQPADVLGDLNVHCGLLVG